MSRAIWAWVLLSILAVITLGVGSCTYRVAERPQVWINVPRSGMVEPGAKVKVVSSASDLDGISQVELRVNGELVAADKSADPSATFVKATQFWDANEVGNYTLEVRAWDGNGNVSDPATVEIQVGRVAAMVPTATNTPTPTPTAAAQEEPPPHTATPTPTRMETPTVTPTGTRTPVATATPTATATEVPTATPTETSPEVSFGADQTQVNAGDYTTLRWDVENVKAVFLDEEGVGGHGTREVGPLCDPQYVHTLRVVFQDDSEESYYVTINVKGTCEVPDTEGPTFGDVVQEECVVGYPANIDAVVSDESGVASVTIHFAYPSEIAPWDTYAMSLQGNKWVGSFPCSWPSETSLYPSTRYYLTAMDNEGNQSSWHSQNDPEYCEVCILY